MIPTRRVYVPIVEEGHVIGNIPDDVSVLCSTCMHWRGNSQCDAYPKVIPIEIWSGFVDHREPYAGDHGIQYELGHNIISPPELMGK